MSASNTPDPYDGFRRDDERRRALNVRAISSAVSDSIASLAPALKGIGVALVVVFASKSEIPAATLKWLLALVK